MNMTLKKVGSWIVIAGLFLMCFCMIESEVHAQSEPRDASLATNYVDPESPNSRAVLDKLNKHLGNSIMDEKDLATLSGKVDTIVSQNLPTTVAVISEKVDQLIWLVKAMLAGLATLLSKEVVEFWRNKFK